MCEVNGREETYVEFACSTDLGSVPRKYAPQLRITPTEF
jgi:hypothetical protein